MADINNLTQFLTDIANSIREKTSTEEEIPASEFDAKIRSIETGTDTSDATATAEDLLSGKTAYGASGRIEGAIENKGTVTVTPSKNKQDLEKGYYESVSISAVTSDIDENITADNIRKDVEILGITGTLEEGTPINNQDKTVTPTIQKQIVTADDTYTGLGTVTVEAVTKDIDGNILPENIKKGTTILGVEGTLETAEDLTEIINAQDKIIAELKNKVNELNTLLDNKS